MCIFYYIVLSISTCMVSANSMYCFLNAFAILIQFREINCETMLPCLAFFILVVCSLLYKFLIVYNVNKILSHLMIQVWNQNTWVTVGSISFILKGIVNSYISVLYNCIYVECCFTFCISQRICSTFVSTWHSNMIWNALFTCRHKWYRRFRLC